MIFLYSHLSFIAAYSFKSQKIGMLVLLNCEAVSLTVFLQPCLLRKQQTSDNLIVKDFCFIMKYLTNLALVVSLEDV